MNAPYVNMPVRFVLIMLHLLELLMMKGVDV